VLPLQTLPLAGDPQAHVDARLVVPRIKFPFMSVQHCRAGKVTPSIPETLNCHCSDTPFGHRSAQPQLICEGIGWTSPVVQTRGRAKLDANYGKPHRITDARKAAEHGQSKPEELAI
jgi:hypothetical protein